MTKLSNIIVESPVNGISRIKLHEPNTYNALSLKTLKSLIEIFKRFNNEEKTKVIIIEGMAKGFSAGHDLKEIRSLKNKKKEYKKLFNTCSKLMLEIIEGRKPVIAKVHGAAFAAGCQLVASCDLAYASSSAKFATPGVNIGLFCSTPMVAISRNLSNKHSMEMLLTGELISSDKAAKIGLINDVIEINKLKDFVLNKAQKISKKSSVTLKIGKEAFYKQLDMKLSDAYDYASRVMVQNMLKLDAKEGIDAFIDKREPKWKDK